MSELWQRPLWQLSQQLDEKQFSSSELTDAFLARAEATAAAGAYAHLDVAGARQAAREADARRAAGTSRSPLDGIPLALKDNILQHNTPSACASQMLAGFVAPYDAQVVTNLRAAGAVLLGKTNMDEFAMGSSNEHSIYGPCLNPWDKTRVPGGSSGGSAAAVALGAAAAALGTDTGGSIRQPAAFTGIVGLKPTYGRISRYGIIAFASSLDQVGPMTRTVRDSALLLNHLAGPCAHDATCSTAPVPDFAAALPQQDAAATSSPLAGLKIGLPNELFGEGLSDAVGARIEEAIALLERLGARVMRLSLPHLSHGVATYYVLASAEASSNLARYDGVRYGFRAQEATALQEMYTASRSQGFGMEVKRRILLGTFVLSAGYGGRYYQRAQAMRTLIAQDFSQAFSQVDVLLSPTCPQVAFTQHRYDADPLQMYLSDVCTVTANLAGLPGISVPCGFSPDNLPVGMQLLAPAWQEARLLHTAHVYEANTPWHTMRPTW